jgi:tRNA(Ile)-lysidine synthase
MPSEEPGRRPGAAREAELDLAVAFSGGLDSTALLHATARSAAGLRVLALHVNHGLQASADEWQQLCQQRAEAMGVGFLARRLTGRPGRGESVEAWAREGRHRALQAMAQQAEVDLLLLAHHRRDQAETWLLQAMRGGGVAGQSAMPRLQWRDGLCWARPWLDQPREAIRRYAEGHGLEWIEDPSNADPRFARNRLRQLWPAFPEAEGGLARAAAWAQQAAALARELAAQDLALLAASDGLDITALRALSPARASNALRAWLPMAPASLIERLQAELHPLHSARWPVPGGTLRAYRGRLSWEPGTPDVLPEIEPQGIDLAHAGEHPQPAWRGVWRVSPVGEGGVSWPMLAALTQRGRLPGDQLQKAPGSPPRALKKAYQEAGVPAWRRTAAPVLALGRQLVFVPGLGLDARALAAPGEAQASLTWVEDADLPQGEGIAGGSA